MQHFSQWRATSQYTYNHNMFSCRQYTWLAKPCYRAQHQVGEANINRFYLRPA